MKNTSKRKNRRALIGKGDYSEAVLKMPAGTSRLEAKIDHLEKSLNKTTPTIKGAAATIGRTLGNFVNQGDLGALAGSSLAKLFGHGDYTVKTNSLMSSNSGPMVPKFYHDGKRGTRIIEREYLGEIRSGLLSSGSSLFTNVTYPINVSNGTTFPWLSNIAQQFDQWEPNGIVFEFVSTSSTFNGTSQALGTVIMATDYDITDAAFGTKQQMENADYACSTRPSENLLHGVECDVSERPTRIFYTGSNQASLSLLGNFQLATVGCSTSNTVLGELWVSYDITFFKKQQVNPILYQPYLNAYGTAASGLGYMSTPTSVISNQISLIPVVGVGSQVQFPVTQGDGYYLLYYHATTTTSDNIWSPVNCNYVSRSMNLPGTENFTLLIITINAPNATITTGLTTSTKTNYALIVTPVASSYAV